MASEGEENLKTVRIVFRTNGGSLAVRKHISASKELHLEHDTRDEIHLAHFFRTRGQIRLVKEGSVFFSISPLSTHMPSTSLYLSF